MEFEATHKPVCIHGPGSTRMLVAQADDGSEVGISARLVLDTSEESDGAHFAITAIGTGSGDGVQLQVGWKDGDSSEDYQMKIKVGSDGLPYFFINVAEPGEPARYVGGPFDKLRRVFRPATSDPE